MRWPEALAAIVGLGSLAFQPIVVAAQGETKIHEKGRCAIRGHCGKQSIFGGELPCPDNDLAKQPENSVREKLVNLCGSKWSEGPVCCKDEQV
jgi:Niemann-Pick C1 protein